MFLLLALNKQTLAGMLSLLLNIVKHWNKRLLLYKMSQARQSHFDQMGWKALTIIVS